jgi:DNA-binding NtrC family response regulator
MEKGRRRVLIVEEDPGLREIFEVVLHGAGYVVDLLCPRATTGDVAERGVPDVIVLEIREPFPRDWDILDLLQARRTTSAIPVVAVTGSERAAGQAKCSPNTRETLLLPFDPDTLETAAGRVLADAHRPPRSRSARGRSRPRSRWRPTRSPPTPAASSRR